MNGFGRRQRRPVGATPDACEHTGGIGRPGPAPSSASLSLPGDRLRSSPTAVAGTSRREPEAGSGRFVRPRTDAAGGAEVEESVAGHSDAGAVTALASDVGPQALLDVLTTIGERGVDAVVLALDPTPFLGPRDIDGVLRCLNGAIPHVVIVNVDSHRRSPNAPVPVFAPRWRGDHGTRRACTPGLPRRREEPPGTHLPCGGRDAGSPVLCGLVLGQQGIRFPR